MSGILYEQMQADIKSLGWRCHEVEIDGEWTLTLSREDTSIVSRGADHQLVWNQAHREALKVSAKAERD